MGKETETYLSSRCLFLYNWKVIAMRVTIPIISYPMIFSQFWQADFVTSPVYLIFKFPVTMGENIRIFHIEIIHLIGCNITTVIVIIFTKNTFELLNQLISEIRTYLNSGTNSLMRSKPASEDKSPPSKFILICLCFLMIRCLQYS